MTREEYYRRIRDEWARVNKKDRNAVHQYNVWRNELLHEVYESEEKARNIKKSGY